jgi:putative transposase
MSRRGNCHDRAIEGAIGSSPMARAVAEIFFQLLKRERIRRRTYLTGEAARQDVFDQIEMSCNPKRRHTNNGMLSPVD